MICGKQNNRFSHLFLLYKKVLREKIHEREEFLKIQQVPPLFFFDFEV